MLDGCLTRTHVPDAGTIPGAFTAPGLVDAHTHLFLKNYAACDADTALHALHDARALGVLLLRDLGEPVGSPVAQLPERDDLPVVIRSGPWLATDQFFPDGRHIPIAPDELVAAVSRLVDEGLSWVKVVADFREPELLFPAPDIAKAVHVAHRAGARVAAHVGSAVAARACIDARVDSIEHAAGGLDDDMIRELADHATAWVPTLSGLEDTLSWARGVLADPSGVRQPVVEQATKFKAILEEASGRATDALEAATKHGVRILAGADNGGSCPAEIRLLARYGMSSEAAMAAATTDAREFLGATGLTEGGRADIVTYLDDPRNDLDALDRPAAVLVGGALVTPLNA